MVKNRPLQRADRRQQLAIAKIRNAKVGVFAPQDALLRIDQSFVTGSVSLTKGMVIFRLASSPRSSSSWSCFTTFPTLRS